MSDTATVQTGADQAAVTLAAKLKAAGWVVRVSRRDTIPPTFADGRPMYAPFRNVFIHADGPRSIGRPYLHLYWHVDLADGTPPVKFSGDILMRGQDEPREFTGETELAAWLAALIAAAAALDA